MKKLLVILSILGLGMGGAMLAGAQYYGGSYYGTTYVPSTSYQYTYGAAIGSYTIGCTTYYYNMTTGAAMGSQNICTTTGVGTYAYPAVYTYPVTTTYGTSYTYPSSQHCTWDYYAGTWRHCPAGNMYGGSQYYNYPYNNNYQNYLNCYYDQYGQYICW